MFWKRLAAGMVGMVLAAAPAPRTRNVVLVMVDGLRWQEVFRGADPALVAKARAKGNLGRASRFEAGSDLARRRRLMPFLWSRLAREGQVFGNRSRGSCCQVLNGRNVSYPGYSETLCGYPDEGILGNEPHPNANVSVFEWLQERRPDLRGRVEAVGSWVTTRAIFNHQRCGFPVHIPGEGRPFDQLDDGSLEAALAALRERKPRLLFLMMGETDGWAHRMNYGRYLKAAARMDRRIERLWSTLQSLPEYRGTTTLLLTTDHGRGAGVKDWWDHGPEVAGAEATWAAVMGPDTPALGERGNGASLFNRRIAGTIAALFGEDYGRHQRRAGARHPELFAR